MTKIEELKIKVAYIGADTKYWEKLKSHTSEYFGQTILGLGDDRKNIQFEYKTISDPEDQLHYKKFILTRQFSPKILYIDLSNPAEEDFNLLKLIRDCELTRNIAVVCLFREETNFNNVIKALHSGANLAQFKSNDNWFSIYNAFKITFPSIILNKKYAQIEYMERTNLQSEMRIQYMSNSRILLESRMEIPQKKIVDLDWDMDSKIVPQKTFKLLEFTHEDSYYGSPYLYKYEQLFISKNDKKQTLFDKEKLRLEAAYENVDSSKLNFIEEDTDISPELILYDKKNNTLNEKYIKIENLGDEQLKELYRGKLLNWIIKHNKRGTSLKQKVLVIDRLMQLLVQKSPFNEFGCDIRIQDYIKDFDKELINYKPRLIGIRLDNTKEEDNFKETNFFTLRKVISACQKIHDYFPIIILFNCPADKSINLQHDFEYHQLIAHKGQINIKIIQLLVKSLTDKNEAMVRDKAVLKMKEYTKAEKVHTEDLSVEDFINAKANFLGTEKFSSLWYPVPIEISQLSESEIEFFSEEALPEKSLLRFSTPVLFYVTIVHNLDKKQASGRKKYKAVIHSITHKRAQLLRQYINKIMEFKNDNGDYIPPSLIDNLKLQIKVKDV